MAAASYRPVPFDGDCVLFFAEPYAWADPEQTAAWSGMLRGRYETRHIPGSHSNLIDEPHVAGLAAEMRRVLETANGSTTG